MPYNSFVPTVAPESSSGSDKLRYEANSFGDGYEQDVILGLNPVVKERTLTWSVLSKTNYDAIIAFFKANAGKTFLWAEDGVNATKWKCYSWSPSIDRASYSLTAEFKEVFA